MNEPPGKSAVKRATGPRYSKSALPLVPAPDPASAPRKNTVHSILIALPIVMLLIGLYSYFSHERAQSNAEPILAESQTLNGEYGGLSMIGSGRSAQHFLWLKTEQRDRGLRMRALDRARIEVSGLQRGMPIEVQVAPSIPGSRVLWMWWLGQGERVLIDRSSEQE